MRKIAVVGSGFVGRAWAISFARGGYAVSLFDDDAGATGRALSYLGELVRDLELNDLLNGARSEQVLARIVASSSLEAALDGAIHVQENIPEDVEVKRGIFARLDALAAPEAVLASSSSGILPSAFTADLKGRERCLVLHPLNPPYLIPAAELVPAPWTSPDAVERTAALMLEVGQKPIRMAREIDGFVMNRLQGALLEEAFRLVGDGYASVEDVDVAIRDGLALRWSFMGPFETIDLNAPAGICDYVARYGPLYRSLFESMQRRVEWDGPVLSQIEAERRQRVPASQLHERQQWRDRRLMSLAAHKRRAAVEIGD